MIVRRYISLGNTSGRCCQPWCPGRGCFIGPAREDLRHLGHQPNKATAIAGWGVDVPQLSALHSASCTKVRAGHRRLTHMGSKACSSAWADIVRSCGANGIRIGLFSAAAEKELAHLRSMTPRSAA